MTASTSVGLSTSSAQGVYLPALGDSQIRNAVRTIHQLARGQTNSKGTFTLSSSGATSVSVSHVNCTPNSIIHWTPVTPDAASVVANVYVLSTNVTTGKFTVNQASGTATSAIFNYTIHS